MIWLDATLQALLDAQCLKRMAAELGHEEDAFYYDEWRSGKLNGVKSVAAYWALLAEVVPQERLERFIAHLDNEKEFKRPNRVPTLSADHPLYSGDGGYWRGAVWAPTNYMILRGLEAHGRDKLAHEIAQACMEHVTKVFNDTDTLWENYAPEFVSPGMQNGRLVGKNFVGWSGLFPISVLYEYIMGIKSDPVHAKLRWDVRLTEAHGIVDYPFGDTPITLRCEERASQEEEPVITVESPVPVEVEICWGDGKRRIISKE
ncbi:MAG: hypothetical protein IJA83_05315 [Clostridia bacterium]|nr:hypothetical protein [Clostridia bacterium]